MTAYLDTSLQSAETALQTIDPLVFAQTGCYLNDLERLVFLGSWQGKTYQEIYPINPQYIEKSVGYRLWRKLSAVLGEKVSKKRIRGCFMRYVAQQTQALEKELTPTYRIAVCLTTHDVSAARLAEQVSRWFRTEGHWVVLQPVVHSDESFSDESFLTGNWDYIVTVNKSQTNWPSEQHPKEKP